MARSPLTPDATASVVDFASAPDRGNAVPASDEAAAPGLDDVHAAPVPDDVHAASVPDDVHAASVPDDVHAASVPDDVHAASVPDDADDDQLERGPERRCIVTRVSGPRAAMLRFVVGPGDVIVPDILAKLPGRGIWLSASRDVLETARSKGAFSRAARRRVTVPADLTAIVETALTRRVGELIGLARRAGQVAFGFVRAREVIASGRCGLVVQASDGSADECSRLLSGAGDLKVVMPLNAAALGVACGHDHIVHVAITPGRLAGVIAVEAERLAGVRSAGTSREQVSRRAGV